MWGTLLLFMTSIIYIDDDDDDNDEDDDDDDDDDDDSNDGTERYRSRSYNLCIVAWAFSNMEASMYCAMSLSKHGG